MRNTLLPSFLILAIVRIAFAQDLIKSQSDLIIHKTDSTKEKAETQHYVYNLISFNDFNLGKGKGMYQNNWLLFNNFSFGINDHLTVNAGFFPIGLAWIGFKIGFPVVKNRINIGLSSSLIFNTYLGSTETINFGQLTVGPKEANFTFGIGKGSSLETIMTLKGMLKINQEVYFFIENYTSDFDMQTNDFISISGFRFVLKNDRSCFELGFLIMPKLDFESDNDKNKNLAFPLFGFSFPLHKK